MDVLLKKIPNENKTYFYKKNLPEYLQCMSNVLLENNYINNIYKVKIVSLKKKEKIFPKIIYTIENVEINKIIYTNNNLIFPKKEVKIKGRAILWYEAQYSEHLIEERINIKPQEELKIDNPSSLLLKIAQSKKLANPKFDIQNNKISLKISSKSGKSFELFEQDYTSLEDLKKNKILQNQIKKELSFKAIDNSILLKIPIQDEEIEELNPIQELNELAMRDKILINYSFSEKIEDSIEGTLTLSKKFGNEYYFETYKAAAKNQKDSKKKLAEQVLAKSFFIQKTITGEKYKRRVKYNSINKLKILEEQYENEKDEYKKKILKEEIKRTEDEAIMEIAEGAKYFEISSYYDLKTLRIIKKLDWTYDLNKITEQEKDEKNKMIEEILTKSKPNINKEYYKVHPYYNISPQKKKFFTIFELNKNAKNVMENFKRIYPNDVDVYDDESYDISENKRELLEKNMKKFKGKFYEKEDIKIVLKQPKINYLIKQIIKYKKISMKDARKYVEKYLKPEELMLLSKKEIKKIIKE